MPILSNSEIAEVLTPFYPECSGALLDGLSAYLDLLVKWNARTNLSAIREPREIVRRHFGESLFAARHLPPAVSLLDLGSGAGFPGVPIQLVHPELVVTLAESQNKKATFLREATRTLQLGCEVFAGRIEAMPLGRRFDVVTLRAVDQPGLALDLARQRVAKGGLILQLSAPVAGAKSQVLIPGSTGSFLNLLQ